ncbi:MAG: hypothetical protein AB8I08_31225 [Sandaracinaceae bacterium]
MGRTKMQRRVIAMSAVWLMACGAATGADASPPTDGADDAERVAALEDTRLAVSEDVEVADAASARLRARGPEGLAAIVAAHPDTLASLRDGERTPRGERLRRAIDRVSAQRDGHASGLYWHTDLPSAMADAERTGRPILSLRLLGRLDEEMSCANSRYFRIVLYSHPELAATLRRDWVLHWSSERPAPRITIDMGDGRQIQTTITGNSVHYVLNAAGRPVDAMVGLYTPEAFGDALAESQAMLACEDEACLARQHQSQRQAFETRWAEHDGEIISLRRAKGQLPRDRVAPGFPSATSAMQLTMGKMFVETPLLTALGADRPPEERVNWEHIGNVLYGQGTRDQSPLHPETQALLRLKTRRANVGEMAVRLAEVARADTARNEVLFRLRIRELFVSRAATTRTLDGMNAFVYERLLETPITDPWLGLRAPDLYDGVEVRTLD